MSNGHTCKAGCPHWCPKSPTKKHRFICVTEMRRTRGTCRYCGKARLFDALMYPNGEEYGEEES